MIDGLAVIADDLTGACDLAGSVVAEGWTATVQVGVPNAGATDARADSRVVALKSRTADPEVAAAESAEAARALLDRGSGLLYQKYCSTFDSTDRGNIGPVADALATVAAVPPALTVGTPATPMVGRTQYLGHLFVDGVPLAESPMRDHPLTPMRDGSVPRLLAAQTNRPVRLVPHDVVLGGVTALRAAIDRAADEQVCHLLVDAICDDDLDIIARAIIDAEAGAQHAIVAAGAAGLATAIARVIGPRHAAPMLPTVPPGGRLIVAGSASAATRRQIRQSTAPRLVVDPLAIAADPRTIDILNDRLGAMLADQTDDGPVLVHASNEPVAVARARDALGAREAAHLLEHTLAHLASRAVHAHGVTRMIIAGGETSGALVAGLGIAALTVGAPHEPGLPWTVGVPDRASDGIAVLLKSGNFGTPDLFTTAWRTAP